MNLYPFFDVKAIILSNQCLKIIIFDILDLNFTGGVCIDATFSIVPMYVSVQL